MCLCLCALKSEIYFYTLNHSYTGDPKNAFTASTLVRPRISPKDTHLETQREERKRSEEVWQWATMTANGLIALKLPGPSCGVCFATGQFWTVLLCLGPLETILSSSEFCHLVPLKQNTKLTSPSCAGRFPCIFSNWLLTNSKLQYKSVEFSNQLLWQKKAALVRVAHMTSSAVLSIALILCSVHCDCALPFPYVGFLPADRVACNVTPDQSKLDDIWTGGRFETNVQHKTVQCGSDFKVGQNLAQYSVSVMNRKLQTIEKEAVVKSISVVNVKPVKGAERLQIDLIQSLQQLTTND